MKVEIKNTDTMMDSLHGGPKYPCSCWNMTPTAICGCGDESYGYKLYDPPELFWWPKEWEVYTRIPAAWYHYGDCFIEEARWAIPLSDWEDLAESMGFPRWKVRYWESTEEEYNSYGNEITRANNLVPDDEPIEFLYWLVDGCTSLDEWFKGKVIVNAKKPKPHYSVENSDEYSYPADEIVWWNGDGDYYEKGWYHYEFFESDDWYWNFDQKDREKVTQETLDEYENRLSYVLKGADYLDDFLRRHGLNAGTSE